MALQALQGDNISLRRLKMSVTDLLHYENMGLALKYRFGF